MITIEGLIGAGKSTLVGILKENGFKDVFTEPISEWNVQGFDVLKAFYSDPKRYAFVFQTYCLQTRVNQLRQASIAERSLLSDSMFASAQHRLGNMDDLEFAIYNTVLADATSRAPKCRGHIYVRTSPKTCLSRIMGRSRDGEDVVGVDYLELLEELHESYFGKLGKQKVLIIDGEEDFHDPVIQKVLVGRIREFQSRLE